MKWRCTWCGKPHAENDPPCDNCGHNKFEKAVVRADEPNESADGNASSATDNIDPETGSVDTGTSYVWRCTNCGRDHVKFNPPCSRCGEHDLEKIEQRYDDIDDELETSSWLEVAKPYTPILAGFLVIVALFATGIVPLSIIPGVGAPSPPDAPGEGSEAAGIDLEETELEIHERLEGERDASRSYDDDLETSSWLEVAKPYTPILAGFLVIVALFATGIVPLSIIPGVGAPSPPDAPGEGSAAAGIDLEETELEIHERLEEERDASRSYDEDLAAYAEYNNRAFVSGEEDEQQVSPGDFGVDCSDVVPGQATVPLSVENYDDEAALADDLASGLATNEEVTASGYDREGLDVHVVGDSIYIHYAAC